ncbi:hypothetical protein HZB58_00700 [Candidatus Gottesmanbacteria bacterium]|nr:hypothetical protein [Candidatus Gottesmanbacteria bacterium]
MKRKRQTHTSGSINWLPVDSRLILPLFSFSHVRGAAKLFLTVEMVLALGVVIGTLAVMILHYLA